MGSRASVQKDLSKEENLTKFNKIKSPVPLYLGWDSQIHKIQGRNDWSRSRFAKKSLWVMLDKLNMTQKWALEDQQHPGLVEVQPGGPGGWFFTSAQHLWEHNWSSGQFWAPHCKKDMDIPEQGQHSPAREVQGMEQWAEGTGWEMWVCWAQVENRSRDLLQSKANKLQDVRTDCSERWAEERCKTPWTCWNTGH